MSNLIKLASNCVVAKLIDAPPAAINLVAELLSYLVDGVNFMNVGGSWDGRSSFYARKNNTFPAGFVHMVHSELIQKGYKVQIVKAPALLPVGEENPVVDEFGNDNPSYDFQMKALKSVERHQRGIVQVATGGGKSKIAKLVMARYKRMTLFLTTRGILMYQMRDDCVKNGFNVGVIGDGQFTPVRGINVGMVQTLISALEEPDLNSEIRNVVKKNAVLLERAIKKKLPKPPEMKRADAVAAGTTRYDEKLKNRNRFIKLLGMFEVVIGEEAHEAGGNSYYEILKHCKNAQIRVALTATPFMRDNAEDNMRLMAAFGPRLIIVSEKTLIDRGILAQPYFKFHCCDPAVKLHKTSPYQRAIEIGIVRSVPRNTAILGYVRKAMKYKLPTMILVGRTDHGDILKKMIGDIGGKVKFIQGENDQVERKLALNQLKSGLIDVLIGTTILDVGVDVPAVGMVILAGGGKAEVALRQRIGRGARAKKKGPNVFYVVDFEDSLNTHLKNHAKERRTIIEDTPGFCEQILQPNEDFNWSIFENGLKHNA